MEGITINIPVKPHLIRYILKKCKATEPYLRLTNDDPIGFGYYFQSMVSKKRSYYICRTSGIQTFSRTINRSVTLPIVLGSDQAHRSGLLLNDEKYFCINEFLEKQFRNEMMIFINSNNLYNPRFVVEDGMEDFLNRYNISEDDIKKETLVKYYHRNKEKTTYL